MFNLQEVTAEGIRPNWKNVGILMAILAAVGLGIFFLVAILNKGNGITYEELEQQAQVQGVTASVSVAPELRDKISVSFQIKESDLEYGFLTGDGKVKNISSKVIEEMILTYKVAGDSREYSLPMPFIGVKPGEEKDFYIGQQKIAVGSNSIVFGARITWGAETTVQPPTAQTPNAGVPVRSWDIDTPSGKVILNYKSTEWARQNLKFFKEGDKFFIENISGKPITGLSMFNKITLRDGRVVSEKVEIGTVETRQEIIDINTDIDPQVAVADIWFDAEK